MKPLLDEILKERGKRYGGFDINSKIAQDLKNVMHTSPSWAKMRPPQREALEMIAGKIGRILTGDPEYQDSWTDIGGYAKLAEDECEPVVEKAAKPTEGMPVYDISWAQVRELVVEKIIGRGPIRVYGIPRGGAIVAGMAMMERPQAIKVVDDPNQADIIVDDIYETGETAMKFIKFGKEMVYLIDKRRKFTDVWLRMPWERRDEPTKRDN